MPPQDVTTYFTGLAEVYDAHRPSYPREAMDAALEGLPRPARAADVGCGTGIATRLLAEAGAHVIGIDPNEDMLKRARTSIDHGDIGISFRCAPAEATGLPTDAFDLVLCAQAFHWFDADAALREFQRILRAGGRLALMWNVRTRDDAFGEGYETLVNRARHDATSRGRVLRRGYTYDPASSGFFTSQRKHFFSNHHEMDWPTLLGRARSASYFPQDGVMKEELEGELRALFDRHAKNGLVTLRQRTEVTLADVVKV